MSKSFKVLALLLLIAFPILSSCSIPPDEISPGQPGFQTGSIDGFLRAEGPREWSFPEDFGPHPEFQTEWWYYTGTLQSSDGSQYGYQLTFFRRGLTPQQVKGENLSAWRTTDIFMAHFALADQSKKEHSSFEIFSRGSAGLAGATSNPFQVWTENWMVKEIEDNQFQIKAAKDGVEVDLVLSDIKGKTFHGDQGYSRKGSDPGNASYYFSQTRLSAEGFIRNGSERIAVTGQSWMDHEFSTSALAAGQVGWDWFSIQLSDGSELMVYQIRQEDGSIDPYSSGTFITAEGKTFSLSKDQFNIEIQQSWESPRSGAVYPSAWKIDIPELKINLEVQPYFNDQELLLSFTYWEGAVKITGFSGEIPVTGNGYVELTGYLRAFNLDF